MQFLKYLNKTIDLHGIHKNDGTIFKTLKHKMVDWNKEN